jgi:hypothetical protein
MKFIPPARVFRSGIFHDIGVATRRHLLTPHFAEKSYDHSFK